MARILISTLPVLGHINPALAAGRKLKAAGHEVMFALPAYRRLSVEPEFSYVATNDDEFIYEPVALRFSPRYIREDIRKIERNVWAILAIWTCSQINPL